MSKIINKLDNYFKISYIYYQQMPDQYNCCTYTEVGKYLQSQRNSEHINVKWP